MAKNYPATKKLTNKDGNTPLQVAQKLGFKRIAEFLLTRTITEQENPSVSADEKPKHSFQTLVEASKNGRVKIIKEFCDEVYESIEEKKRICETLIQVAKSHEQNEILAILESYYTEKLKKMASNQNFGSDLSLDERQIQILRGFLTALSEIITDSPVVLDPDSPETYKELLNIRNFGIEERMNELQDLSSEKDICMLNQKELKDITEKLEKITDQLSTIKVEKTNLEKQIEDTRKQLKEKSKQFEEKQCSAHELKKMFEHHEELEKRLASCECFMYFYQREQEAIYNRRSVVNFIKKSSNLYLFYRTIENRLQALFHGVLTAQSGLLVPNTTTGYGTAAHIVDAVPASLIPFCK